MTTTSFDDTTATAGVVYYYFVKAKNTDGTSGFSVGDAGSRASAPTTTVVLQAESATNSGGAVATKYAGYTGSGYVDFGGSGKSGGYHRDTFYVWAMPPQLAQWELSQTRYFGGGSLLASLPAQ